MQEEIQPQQNLPDHLQQYFTNFQYLNCQEHQNEDLTLICVDCNCQNYFQPSCSECLVKYHKSHNNSFIKSLKTTLTQIQESLFTQTSVQIEKNQQEQSILQQINQFSQAWIDRGQQIQKLCEQMSQIYKKLFNEIQQINQFQTALYYQQQAEIDLVKGTKNVEELKKQLLLVSKFTLFINNKTTVCEINDDKKSKELFQNFNNFAENIFSDLVKVEKRLSDFQTEQNQKIKVISKVNEIGKWAKSNGCRRILMKQEKQEMDQKGYYTHKALTKEVKYDYTWSSGEPAWTNYTGSGWYKQQDYIKCGDCETFCKNCYQNLPQQLQTNQII